MKIHERKELIDLHRSLQNLFNFRIGIPAWSNYNPAWLTETEEKMGLEAMSFCKKILHHAGFDVSLLSLVTNSSLLFCSHLAPLPHPSQNYHPVSSPISPEQLPSPYLQHCISRERTFYAMGVLEDYKERKEASRHTRVEE